MREHFDALETREPEAREAELFERLPGYLEKAVMFAAELKARLADVELSRITSRAALATLPVLRKAELLELQQQNPPFGGFADNDRLKGRRLFMSPGPIFEPQGDGPDPAQGARALFAAGFRPGDTVHNALSYHLTPGGFILDLAAIALGCTVLPAGVGNTDAQVEAAAIVRPDAYCGTPDFLKVMLDRAAETGRDLSSIRRAFVSGGALFPSLREEYRARGVAVMQGYATAEFGVIAYETTDAEGSLNPGMVVSENLIVEVVRPGTGDPVPDGEVGELVVTGFNETYAMVRLATGDLTAILPGRSPCGRTNTRIRGWLGRADQRTKVKGMFVDPKQIAEIVARHPSIARARLVVARDGAQDAMTLHVEPAQGAEPEAGAIRASLRDVTKLGGDVVVAAPGSLPNDGKVIADERDYSR